MSKQYRAGRDGFMKETLMTHPNSTVENTSSTPPRRKRGVAPTENQLLALASEKELPTKKAAREILQSSGLASSSRFVDEFLALAEYVKEQRLTRIHKRIEQRLGYVPKSVGAAPACRPATPPVRTVHKRLTTLRVREVAAAARSVLRYGATGGSSMTVGFADEASGVGYSVELRENWDTYRGSFKGWKAKEDHHLIHVPKDWRHRVQRKGLALLGGMMTLDAHQLLPHGDVQLFSATWARQGRGYEVIVDRGFIALLDGEHYHGETIEGAAKGVRRKASTPRSAPASAFALSIEDFVKRYGRYRLNVAVRDAQDSGSCDYGIRSWCESVGIAYSDNEAPLERVLEGFRMLPQEEVRRAVLHAVRRHRKERQGSAV